MDINILSLLAVVSLLSIGIMTAVPVAYASSDEPPECSPPVPYEEFLLERCASGDRLIDPNTGEVVGSVTENEGVRKACETDEQGRTQCIQVS